MKKLLLICFALMLDIPLFAAGEQALITNANKAYAAGNFSEAIALYHKVTAAGYESADLYYNLGNTYFKMNDYARAILWYERARRLDPSSEDITFNLNVANTKIYDKIEPLPEMFYKRWFTAIVHLASVDGWAAIGVILFVVSLLSGVLYLASRVLILRKAGFWAGSGFMIISVFSLLMAWSSYANQKSSSEAIVFEPTITVKSSPDEKGTDLFVVHEGTKVSLLDNIGGWYEIRIANGSVGWLPVTALEKI